MSVFGTANFRVGWPTIEFLILCAENHFHHLTGFKVLRSCGTEFNAVGQMHFQTCGKVSSVVFCTVPTTALSSALCARMSLAPSRTTPGSACSWPAPSAPCSPWVCSLTTQPLSASVPSRTVTTRATRVDRRGCFDPAIVGVKPLFVIRADRRRSQPGAWKYCRCTIVCPLPLCEPAAPGPNSAPAALDSYPPVLNGNCKQRLHVIGTRCSSNGLQLLAA